MPECKTEVSVVVLAPHATDRVLVRAFYTCGCFSQYRTESPPDIAWHVRQWMECRRDSVAAQLKSLTA